MNALLAECNACRHVWMVAKLPMPLHLTATAAARATCPQCGEIERITVASKQAAEAWRRQQPAEAHRP